MLFRSILFVLLAGAVQAAERAPLTLAGPMPAPTSPTAAPAAADLGAVAQGLKASSLQARVDAVDALARTQDPAALAWLEPRLGEGPALFRRHLVRALGSLRSKRVPALLKGWLGDRDPEVRACAAAMALEWPPDPGLEAPLLGLLKDPAPAVRAPAAAALGVWRCRAALQPLEGILQSGPASLRRKAAQALGNIGDPAAIPALSAAEGQGDPLVRNAAATALGQIRGTQGTP